MIALSPRPAAALAAALVLLAAWPGAVCIAEPSTGMVDVLFFFTPEDYAWGTSDVNGTISALTASRNAASFLNKGFVYKSVPNGTYIEIGGLAPPPGSWNWTLLKWNASGGWEEWKGPAAGLSAGPGEAICWCPGNELFPAPDPLTKYPWTMFKANAARTAGSLSPVPAGNLTFWTARLASPVLSSPCAATGKLFVVAGGPGGGQSFLAALEISNGSVAWRRDLGASGPAACSPAYSGGKVIVGLGDGRLAAFNARTGEPAWEFNGSAGHGPVGSPVIVHGDVIYTANDGRVFCVRANGTAAWEAQVNASAGSQSSPAVWLDRAGKGPSDRLVVATAGGGLACLNISDGATLWSIGLGLDPATGLVEGTPAISQFGHAFVPVINRDASGAWKSMNLYGINLGDSIIQWNASYSPTPSSPAYQGDGLFLGTGTELTGHHPTRGTRFWGIPVSPVECSPAACGGYVFFALNSTNGTAGCARVGGFLEWTLDLGTAFRSSPVIADGRLFLCGMDGSVFCLGRPPRARLSAVLGNTAPATAGSTVGLKATIKNTGEAAATFIAYLTVDGNRTAVKTGPIEVPAGGTRTAALEWKAQTGIHRLNMTFEGAEVAVNETTINVSAAPNACAGAVAVISIVGFAAAVPMIAAFSKRRGGTGR